jgi:hypothetical protein
MSMPAPVHVLGRAASPFDLEDALTYRRWRDWKLTRRPASAGELLVNVADPRALTQAERLALRAHILRANVAVYRSPVTAEDPQLPRLLGAQLGLQRIPRSV